MPSLVSGRLVSVSSWLPNVLMPDGPSPEDSARLSRNHRIARMRAAGRASTHQVSGLAWMNFPLSKSAEAPDVLTTKIATRLSHELLSLPVIQIHDLDASLPKIIFSSVECLVLANDDSRKPIEEASPGTHVARRQSRVHRGALESRGRETAGVLQCARLALSRGLMISRRDRALDAQSVRTCSIGLPNCTRSFRPVPMISPAAFTIAAPTGIPPDAKLFLCGVLTNRHGVHSDGSTYRASSNAATKPGSDSIL